MHPRCQRVASSPAFERLLRLGYGILSDHSAIGSRRMWHGIERPKIRLVIRVCYGVVKKRRMVNSLNLLSYKKHIPRPSADTRALRIKYLCAIAKGVAKLVSSPRFLIVEVDSSDSKLGQSMKLASF